MVINGRFPDVGPAYRLEMPDGTNFEFDDMSPTWSRGALVWRSTPLADLSITGREKVRMRAAIAVTFLMLSSAALAEDEQAACGVKLDEMMKQMGALVTAAVGQLTYTQIFERAQQCVVERRCGKADAFIAISEMMVDEKIVEIQREKIAALKKFFVQAKPYEHDACALLERFPPLLSQVSTLNEKQLRTFVELAEKQFQNGT